MAGVDIVLLVELSVFLQQAVRPFIRMLLKDRTVGFYGHVRQIAVDRVRGQPTEFEMSQLVKP